jgi:hypothetical protein
MLRHPSGTVGLLALAVGAGLIIAWWMYIAPRPVVPSGGLVAAPQQTESSLGEATPDAASAAAGRDLALPAQFATAAVAFLDVQTRQPPPLEGWRMRAAGGTWEPLPTATDGVVVLPRAVWAFVGPPGYEPLEDRVDLMHAEQVVVWVRRLSELEVHVFSRADGAPVPLAGVAHARWPRRIEGMPQPFEAGDWSDEVLTSATGVATLRHFRVPCAVRVLAAGFCPVLLDVDGVESPLRVALDPVAWRPVRVRVLDATTMAAIVPTAVHGWSGSIGFTAAPPDGIDLMLPGDLDPQDALVFEAEDYVRAVVRSHHLSVTNPESPCIVMHRSASLVVDVAPADDRDWHVWLGVPDDEHRVAEPFEARFRIEGGRHRLVVPESAVLEVLARTAAGHTCQRTLVTQPGENHLVLAPGGSPLVIDVESVVAQTSPLDVSTVTARVHLDNGLGAFELVGAAGRLRLPFPEQVYSVTVGLAGHEEVLLRRVADPSLDPAGSLRLKLEPANMTRIEVVDEEGAPVAGMRVYLDGAERSSLRSVSDAHPAWIVESRPHWRGVTESRGRIERLLPNGDYRGLVVLPEMLHGGLRPSHYAPQPFVVSVHGGGTHRVVVDAPRRLVVRVTDASTGLPVRAARIRVGDLADRAPVRATMRTIWVTASSRTIRVDAPGFATSVTGVPEGASSVDVLMHPAGEGVLVLEGDQIESLRGATLVLRCYDGYPTGPQHRIDVVVTAPSATAVHLAGSRLDVRIDDLEWQGSRWRFEPIQPEWVAGGRVVFRAVRVGG